MTLKYRLVNYLILAVAVVFLLFCLRVGLMQAEKLKQSELVAANAQVLQAGMRFFYNDYDRFPKASEFQSDGSLVAYFSAFPPKAFISQKCQESFLYQRPTLTSFELAFCLEKAVGGFNRGWNKIINSGN